MRRAELLMALVLALLSVYLMWKSWELPIGWIPDEGPGGGAFPFWHVGIVHLDSRSLGSPIKPPVTLQSAIYDR